MSVGNSSDKQFIELETTGIYEGTVMEDVAVTMKNHGGQRFANIWIPDLWSKNEAYPLTYIDGFEDLPSITKGMKVWVKFEQDCELYPKYYKNMGEIKSKLGRIYEPLSLTNITNNNDNVKGGDLFGDDGAIQVTDKRFAIVFAKTFIVLDNNSLKLYCEGNVSIKTKKSNLEFNDDSFKISSNGGVKIENKYSSLNDCLEKIQELLQLINTACLARPEIKSILETGLSSEKLVTLKTKINSLNSGSLVSLDDLV